MTRPAPTGKRARLICTQATATCLSVQHHLVEGNSILSTERLTSVHGDSIYHQHIVAGRGAADLLDSRMTRLNHRHVEVDEILTFVQKKKGLLKPGENDVMVGDQFICVAMDQTMKLIPSFVLGKRTATIDEKFMIELSGRIMAAKPGEKHIRLQIGNDGFAA